MTCFLDRQRVFHVDPAAALCFTNRAGCTVAGALKRGLSQKGSSRTGSRAPSQDEIFSSPGQRTPTVLKTGQVSDVPPSFARTSPAISEASFAHCRSKATSDGVNIRRAGEVPSLRLSKAIEGAAEMFLSAFFEAWAAFPSEFMVLSLREIQFRRIRLSGQPDGVDNLRRIFSSNKGPLLT